MSAAGWSMCSAIPGSPETTLPPPPKYANFAGEHVMHGRITHCEPPRVLAYTWGEGDGASHVRFELDPVDDQVRLWIVHSRLPNRGEILSVGAGWHTHVDILSDRLQKRVPAGFWATHTRLEAEYERLIPPGQPHLPGGTDPPPASPAATLPHRAMANRRRIDGLRARHKCRTLGPAS